MDDPRHRAVRLVPDRVLKLLRQRLNFARIRHELPGNRIGRVGRIDQPGKRRRDGDGIARGDRVEARIGRDEASLNEFIEAAQGARNIREGRGGAERAVHARLCDTFAPRGQGGAALWWAMLQTM